MMQYSHVLITLFAFVAVVYSANAIGLTINTKYGPVTGLQGDGFVSWRGVPYAAPPTGNLRWKSPQPPKAWTTPVNATKWQKFCPQPVWDFLPPTFRALQSENCLFLNLWVPANATTSSKLPVMVFFHPGGNFKGSSTGVAGDGFATLGNVILVTLNYRLGYLGFLVTEGMLLESTKLNYGLQDQQFALQWVNQNIAAFGGDPSRVTIFGESAGGGDALLHMLMPDSFPYYQQVISESPATAQQAELGEALATGTFVANRAGCSGLSPADTLACLRAVPLSRLIVNFTDAAGVVIDHNQFMDSASILFRTGKYNRNAKLIAGSCAEEGNLLVYLTYNYPPMNKESYYKITEENWAAHDLTEFVLRLYEPVAQQLGYWQAASQAEGDGWINCFVTAATNSTTANGTPTYRYLWTHIPEIPTWIPQSMNATHSVELPFVFHAMEKFTPEEETLSRQTLSYWAAFAHCGDPNGCAEYPGYPRPKWPLHDPTKPNTILELDTKISFISSFRDAQCNAWNEAFLYTHHQ